eukprot:767463-Hanusia_phi.AAC.2
MNKSKSQGSRGRGWTPRGGRAGRRRGRGRGRALCALGGLPRAKQAPGEPVIAVGAGGAGRTPLLTVPVTVGTHRAALRGVRGPHVRYGGAVGAGDGDNGVVAPHAEVAGGGRRGVLAVAVADAGRGQRAAGDVGRAEGALGDRPQVPVRPLGAGLAVLGIHQVAEQAERAGADGGDGVQAAHAHIDRGDRVGVLALAGSPARRPGWAPGHERRARGALRGVGRVAVGARGALHAVRVHALGSRGAGAGTAGKEAVALPRGPAARK